MKGPGDTLIVALNRPREGRQAHAALSFAAPLLSLTALVRAGKTSGVA